MSQQYEIADLADFMRTARDNEKPFVFFTGAGCSITAGVPLAKTLIEEMHRRYKTELKLLVGEDRDNYGKCMAQIGRDDRRQFLKTYIDEAKINWAHIALACLLQAGYISRVLTFNFDNLLARSCGLLGFYPATYDFTAANLNLHRLIENPAVVHLHGQIHGFAQLNTARETAAHAKHLSHFVGSTLNESPALFIGYSGQADAFFPQITDHFSGQHRLFWVDRAEQAPAHIADSILQKELTHYMRCADGADLFLIELAQQLECFPPKFFSDPYSHLLEEVAAVTDYPQRSEHRTKTGDQSDGSRSASITTTDILQELRQRLKEAQQRESDAQRPNYLDLFLQGKYQEIITSSPSVETLNIADQMWVAMAYFHWALEQSDREQEIRLYDQLIVRFGTSDEPTVQEQVVNAMFNKGTALAQLERSAEAITVYDELIARFGTSDVPAVQASVAKALFNKGIALSQLERLEEEIMVYDQLITHFGTRDVPAVQEHVAQALVNKGVTLDQLDRTEEAITVYDELIVRFGTSDMPAVQEQVAKALFNKGVTLAQLERLAEAITVYNELIARFGASDIPTVQASVSMALFNKGIALTLLDRTEEAITAYDEFIARFSTSDVTAVQEQVANALVIKGIALAQLDRIEEAIRVCDELIVRFGTSDVPAVQVSVAKALFNKGIALAQLDRTEETITVYNELIARFGTSDEPAVQASVTRALLNKGTALAKLDRTEETITVYNELIARFGTSDVAAVQEIVTLARRYKDAKLG